jgi:hypothetical protein
MHRFSFPIAVLAILSGACETSSPVEPPQVSTSDFSSEVRHDSTGPAAPQDEATVHGGILIGSGT